MTGLCWRCYRHRAHSRKKFAGLRDEALERDAKRCRVWQHRLAVHHRRPGINDRDELITLCAGCHARIRKMLALRVWLLELFVLLWREQHPALPFQLQFPEIGGAVS
ncbi:MAG: hypothetical protein LC130_36050 [Bryobacterales bacterium]|nr:hypothetical protein [Bryobacterales bacterium]